MKTRTNPKPISIATSASQPKRKLLCVLIVGCFGSAPAWSNPGGAQIVNGQVTFTSAGNLLTVTNSPGAIINWQNFSINAGEITRFVQQNGNSAVLNRIVGQDPSQILGALQSNGKVFLINPNGILFGRGAQIDVNGLVASSLNISNEDFLTGKFNFKIGDKAGNVINQGAITTPSGGQVYLIAPQVENSGVITSPQGDVMLAAGNSVHLVDSTNPDLRVVVSAPADRALNLGQVVAQGGKIGIYGALINQRGVVNADSAVVGENGRIIFKASGDTLLEAGSITSATGAGKGGEIQVLGERVGLLGDAKIDASGQAAGGTVLIGGDYQGKNTAVQNARQTYVSEDASIKADAIGSGDGGKVIVWADDLTRFDGKISARGGAASGNGGFAEVSGKDHLQFRGNADLRAPHGDTGTLLLDPNNITITAAGGESTSASGGAPFINSDTIADSILFPTTLTSQLSSANVLVTTNSGSITVADAVTWSTGFTLSLLAATGIAVNNTITNNGGTLTLATTGGNITQSAAISVAKLAATATAGSITLTNANNHIATLAASAGSGNISVASNTAMTVGTVSDGAATPLALSGITTTGDVSLTVGSGDLSQTHRIAAGKLNANASAGGVSLSNASNAVGTLSGTSSSKDFIFKNASDLTIGTVNSTVGITSDSHVTIETAGSMTVNSPVAFGSGAKLTLNAGTSMGVNAGLSGDGPATIELISGKGFVSGGMSINGVVSALDGTLSMRNYMGNITQSAALRATNALIISDSGSVTLNSSANSIGTLAGYSNGAGGFSYTNAGALTVGTVNGSHGVVSFDGPASLTALTGNMTVSDTTYGANSMTSALNLTATAGQITGTGKIKGTTVTLTAGDTINLAGTGNEATTLVASQTGSTGNISFVNNQALSLSTMTNNAADGAITVSTTASSAYGIDVAGAVSTGSTGTISLNAGATGALTRTGAGSVLSANTIVLQNTSTGAVGTSIAPLLTGVVGGGTSNLRVGSGAGVGALHLGHTGRLSLNSLSKFAVNAPIGITASNDLTTDFNFDTGTSGLSLHSGGTLSDSNASSHTWRGANVNLSAGTDIDAPSVVATSGAVVMTAVNNLAARAISTESATPGAITLTATSGNMTLGGSGDITARNTGAGASAAVTLKAGGYVSMLNNHFVKGGALSFTAGTGIYGGTSAANLLTRASSISAKNLTSGPIRLENQDSDVSIVQMGSSGYGIDQQAAGGLVYLAATSTSGSNYAITVNSKIRSNGGAIDLIGGSAVNLAASEPISSNGGAINIAATATGGQISMPASSSIASSNGSITLTADQLAFSGSTINAGTGAVNLTATNGAISGATVTGSSLQASARSGINLNTAVQTLNATNTGTSGAIAISNTGPLAVQNLTQAVAGTGAISLANIGDVTLNGPVRTASGAITIDAHSALVVNGSVTSTNGGNIALTAVSSGKVTDKLTINGGATVTSSGTLTLTAGDAVTLNTGSTVSPGATIRNFQNFPSLSACIANPALANCNTVLPSLAACTAAPATAGCSVVLPAPVPAPTTPSLAACAARPATANCTAVLQSAGRSVETVRQAFNSTINLIRTNVMAVVGSTGTRPGFARPQSPSKISCTGDQCETSDENAR